MGGGRGVGRSCTNNVSADLGGGRCAFLHRAGGREGVGLHRGWVGRSPVLHSGTSAPHSLRERKQSDPCADVDHMS